MSSTKKLKNVEDVKYKTGLSSFIMLWTKCKFVTVQAMKAFSGSWVLAHSSAMALDGYGRSTLLPGHFASWERIPVPIEKWSNMYFILKKVNIHSVNCRQRIMSDWNKTCWVLHKFNPLNPELNPICYLLALLGAHLFLHVSRIRVKSLTFRLLMSYIYGAPILDVSRSHTTTQHSR